MPGLGRVTARVHAMEHVSFDIHRYETFALVGESGCGISTIAKALVGLVPHHGRIEVAGSVLQGLAGPAQKALTRKVRIIFRTRWRH